MAHYGGFVEVNALRSTGIHRSVIHMHKSVIVLLVLATSKETEIRVTMRGARSIVPNKHTATGRCHNVSVTH